MINLVFNPKSKMECETMIFFEACKDSTCKYVTISMLDLLMTHVRLIDKIILI